ncbi:BamA/TamA family outer membrane protein [Photobacterium sagamiensis]|uniref:BamA/TamA family outer membrane protein n=1 Tax=Photobacterium sagamiensis TaxID=2910241 RepID=UPI003D0D3704
MRILFLYFSLVLSLLFSVTVYSQDIRLEIGEEEPVPHWITLPFLFHTESLDTAYGLAGGTSGYFQPQMSTFGAIMDTTNDSRGLFISIKDYQFQSLPRLFATFTGSIGDWTDQRSYAGFNPDYPKERGGSNESSDDNYITGKGRNNWFDLSFRYLLPTGDGRDTLINTFFLDRGIIESGELNTSEWNPSTSGRLYFETMLFSHQRNFDQNPGEIAGDTNGLSLALEYDNRNFPVDPSKGSFQRFTINRDFGMFDSTSSWTNLDLDLRKYLSLAETKWFRQRVLALNAWTSYTPSWEKSVTHNGPVIDHRPPNSKGASLGGFERLRAYPMHRFSDKAALLYSAEMRLTTQWNPHRWQLLRSLDVDWVQVVPFAEIGRVADSWSASELHKDMKWDLGIGFRFMMHKAVFRAEFATSEDSWSSWMMVGQPF